jgi:hypothetical protein
MTKRVVIGPRANGDVGVFVSPSGVDADTAADSALRLSITSKVSQLILLGRVTAGGHTISLGLGRSPYVFLTSQWDFAGVSGHTLGPGPFRPSPPPISGAGVSYLVINSNGASMSINAAYTCVYAVYGQAFT